LDFIHRPDDGWSPKPQQFCENIDCLRQVVSLHMITGIGGESKTAWDTPVSIQQNDS
jgi:hypothetical protein